MNEPTAVAERSPQRVQPSHRPHFRVRRKQVLRHVPKDVGRSATDLAAYFRISRATAWRLFIADEKRENAGHASAESIAAICAAFPDVPQAELVEVVR